MINLSTEMVILDFYIYISLPKVWAHAGRPPRHCRLINVCEL